MLEVGRASRELANALNVEELLASLQTGGAQGTVGHVNVGVIVLDEMDEALMNAKRRQCTTEVALVLYEAVEMVRCVRAALKFLDWGALRVVLDHWDDQEWQSKWQEHADTCYNHDNNHGTHGTHGTHDTRGRYVDDEISLAFKEMQNRDVAHLL
jgi:hypothetical protein